MTTPPSSPRDPLALDARGVLLELHLIRSGAQRASCQIAVYLPGTLDAFGEPYAYDELGELDRDQVVVAFCAEVYDYLAHRIANGQFAIYDATAPAVIGGLFSAWYASLHMEAGLFALTLTPEQARERNVPEGQRYVLRMREGDVPVQWQLLCASGRYLTTFGAQDTRATSAKRPRKRAATRLADQVERDALAATQSAEVVWQLDEYQTLERLRDRWINERAARGNKGLTGE